MRPPPIPRRIAPLTWRSPAYVWTPLALAVAIGGPFAALGAAGDMAHAALIIGAFVYALALSTLGAAWVLGRAPRSRREVLLHVLGAGLVTSIAAPYAMTLLLAAPADQTAQTLALPAALSLTPLAIVLGLPALLLSGLAFALIALRRPPQEDRPSDDARFNMQPFR